MNTRYKKETAETRVYFDIYGMSTPLANLRFDLSYASADDPTTRIVKGIPGDPKNPHLPEHAKLGQIICFERRDLVADFMQLYLKFFAECNYMANHAGKEVSFDHGRQLEEISFGKNDLHPRHVGIAFFSMTSNIVASWEEKFLDLCQRAYEDVKKAEPELETEESQAEGKVQDEQVLHTSVEPTDLAEQPQISPDAL